MEHNNIMKVLMLFVIALLANSVASAYSPEDSVNTGESLPLEVREVKVDGHEVENGDTITTKVERGENLEIDVQLYSNESQDNVEIEAFISGDDHYTIADTSEVFDVEADEISWEDLELQLPDNMDQDEYDLRVLVTTRKGQAKIYNYNLRISTDRHALAIEDVVMSPKYGVKAGHGLFATVRIKNTGLKDEEGIKISISVPELGMSFSDYIDELEAEDEITSEELWLGRVPECAQPGKYRVDVEVQFDEYTRSVTATEQIEVFEGDLCKPQEDKDDKEEPQETIQVPSTHKNVKAGMGGSVYALVIKNPTSTAKEYNIKVSGVKGWGSSSVTPGNTVVVDGGSSKAISVYVTANKNATAGERTFVVNVASEDSSADIVLTANVQEADKKEEPQQQMDFVKGLQIALLVLVVLLVILGLVLMFNRMRGREGEGMDETQSYY